ncbi:Uncharacterised protein [Bordetella pertussis]|nr:Uncharacterised protein [Bordetella pertussis]CFO76097.1 Uncharacterised protein [Bordetella pertussis]CPL59814.1 Uncharacterised protein [Bordetella pertussis]
MLAIVAIVETTAARGDPQLLHGGLHIDDDLGAVFEHQRQHIAAAGGFDIDIQACGPIVRLAFDTVEHLVDQRKKFGFRHNPTCNNYGVPCVPFGT